MSECPLCNGSKVLIQHRGFAGGHISVPCNCTIDPDHKPTQQQIEFQHDINAHAARSQFKAIENGKPNEASRPRPDLRIVKNN